MLDESSGTATNSVYPLIPSDFIEDRPPKHYPYTFPYFLFPPSKNAMALASNGGGPFEVYAYNISSHYAEFEEMSTGTGHHLHHHHNIEHDSNEHHATSRHHSHQHTHEHNMHHHSLNNNINNNNVNHKHITTTFNLSNHNDNENGTSTILHTGTGTGTSYDREWHREQYNLARARANLGEILTIQPALQL